ncbi:urease accessory protein UreF [Caldimonas brevitalea]|uniref:Urease accessory protein UreF n=1 Tax=Caldimonas brevitalea TaxID=413882 RepID=A0A0G3BT03_9BURK|nr:urease accessory protein UreF [Caldimonas brevitalea]AKJ31138.1 urease accessory protein UreF [Caldimonas brevitalea]
MPRVLDRRAPAAPNPHTLLQLMWLASPALPVGGFSYSEGLEAAIESGRVTNETQAGDWLLDQLQLCLMRNELAVLAQSLRAWRRGDAERVAELNQWVLTTRESAELRQQTEQMGRSLAQWLRLRAEDPRLAVLEALQPAPTYPVAFALAAAQTGAAPREVLLCFAFGWSENMVQAAIKAVPLGQSAGQRMLARLADAIPPAVEQALQLRDAQRQAFAPMLAILSSVHETQYSRLFRS